MGQLAAVPERNPSAPRSNWKWIAIATAAILFFILILVLAFFGRVVAVYELLWGKASIERLLYEDIGLSQSWSAFIAVVGSFFYALAWVPLSLWTYRILAWRFSARQFTVAFLCWAFVYGHVPFLHAMLGTDACFNQRTGAPQKWFIEASDGQITLFDSGGYDVISGSEKHPVTSKICSAFARQKANAGPRKVTGNVRELEFFDAISGRPRIWYHLGPVFS